MANSMHIGAAITSLTDLSGASYALYLRRHERTALSGPQLDVGSLPSLDGGYALANGAEVRRMNLPVTIIGSSHSDAQTKLDAVMALLNPALGPQYLKLDVQNDRAWRGIVAGRVSSQARGLVAVDLDIPWACIDATAYSTTETIQTITVGANPTTANAPASGSVAGSAYAYPVWIIKNTSGGASSALTLTNNTTSEVVSTASGIANGTWIRFDAVRQIIETSVDSGGSWSSAMSIRGSYRNIPRLKPGVANSMTVAGLSSGSLVATYRARYL